MLATTLAFRSFRGRQPDLAHLLDRRREASAGRGGLVLISGEPGSGKSRLLAEFRKTLASGRVGVALAQCRESAGRPYSAVADLLERLTGKPAAMTPASSRAEQFGGILRELRDLCERRTVVAMIEDVHWANADTLDLLETIAADAGYLRLLVVATYRSDSLDEGSPAFNSLAKLHRTVSATHLDLAPLADSDIAALIDESVAGTPLDAHTRREIVRSSEGNPFFAEELLKNAVLIALNKRRDKRLPLAIRATVQERLSLLDRQERETLAQAAVIGRRFSVELLDAALDIERERALQALRTARDLQLVVEEDGDSFSFRHALTREAVHATLLETEARELHRRVAAALESLPKEKQSTQDLAYHWWAARNPAKSLEYGSQAGDEAMRVFAYDDAIRMYGYALEYNDRHGPPVGPILINLGYAYGRNGAQHASVQALSDAILAFRAAGDVRGECEAAIELAAPLFSFGRDDYADAILAVRERLTDNDAGLIARADVSLVQLYFARKRYAEALPILESITIDPQRDDPRTIVTYYAMLAALAGRRADVDRYVQHALSASSHALKSGLINERAVVLSNAGSALTGLGRLTEAGEYIAQCETLCAAQNLRTTLAYVRVTQVHRSILLGDLQSARAYLEECAGISVDASHYLRALTAGWGTLIAALTGDPLLLEQYFQPDVARAEPMPHLAGISADRCREVGRAQQADELIAAGLAYNEAARTSFLLHLAAAKSDRDDLVEQARSQAAEFANLEGDRVFKAALPLFEAIVAKRKGDAERAGAHASVAAQRFGALGYRLWEAEALEFMGRSAEAAAIYRDAGAKARLREVALQPPENRSAGRATETRSTLSKRELEIAELVTGGATNAEVAARLFITVKAVEKHLSSIYAKLGFTSRGKLAAYMAAARGPQLVK